MFTCDPSRFAEEPEREAFENQVSSSQIPTQVGDVDISKLKGPEALLAPGIYCNSNMLFMCVMWGRGHIS